MTVIRRLSILFFLFALLLPFPSSSVADLNPQYGNPLDSSAIEQDDSVKASVNIGKEKINSFFYSCAEHGVFFDTLHPYYEREGTGKVSYQVYYELKYSENPYRLYFNVCTDGRMEYGIDTLGTYMSGEETVFSVFASSIVGIDEESAQSAVKDCFIEAYMRDRPYFAVKDGWKYTVTFSESHRMLLIKENDK